MKFLAAREKNLRCSNLLFHVAKSFLSAEIFLKVCWFLPKKPFLCNCVGPEIIVKILL